MISFRFHGFIQPKPLKVWECGFIHRQRSERVLFLFSELTAQTTEELLSSLLLLEEAADTSGNRHSPVYLHIHSNGGPITHALAILDLMQVTLCCCCSFCCCNYCTCVLGLYAPAAAGAAVAAARFSCRRCKVTWFFPPLFAANVKSSLHYKLWAVRIFGFSFVGWRNTRAPLCITRQQSPPASSNGVSGGPPDRPFSRN